MRLLPLLLFLSACGGPSHAYMDGAPLAPPEPRVTYTPTGTGLPEYWGTPEAPKVERSPHKRDLPPTREPGLWAGDQPRASGGDGWDRILGFKMPLPSDTEDLDFDVVMVEHCAKASQKAVTRSDTAQDIARLSEKETRCLAATLYAICTSEEHDRLSRRDVRLADSARKFRDKAMDWVKEACTDSGETGRVKDLHQKLLKAWPAQESR